MWSPEEERDWFGDLISRGGAREFGFGESIRSHRPPMPATALMNIKKRKEWNRAWKENVVSFLKNMGWIPADIHAEMMLSDSDDHLKRYVELVDESKVKPAIPDDMLMKLFLEEKSSWNRKEYRSPLLCHSDFSKMTSEVE
jgi:hypothetical protein